MDLLRWYSDRVRQRPDTEHTQALLRAVIVWLLLIHTAWLAANAGDVAPVLWGINAFSAAFSILLLARILQCPEVSPLRRIAGLVHDNICVTVWLYYAGPIGALALFVYPFSTVGNGFRFGVRYLLLSGFLGAAGIAVLVTTAPGWTAHAMIGYGVLMSHAVVMGYTGVLLRQLHHTQQQLRQLATRDALTGLPNRRFFMDLLARFVESADRQQLACLYVDLDGFKGINDRHGHEVGDQLLNEVGRRVLRCIRRADVLARLGGDEFTVMLTSPCSPEHAKDVASRVIRTVEGITEIDGQPVEISASIGISFVPDGHLGRLVGSDELLKAADEAMYAAKRSGPGHYRFSELVAGSFAPAA
jgi:diguanylate cyclase (GGDEF)-like protein